MYYVIKVGNYYVKKVETEFGGFIGNIILSKEVMTPYSREGAERIAKLLNGEVKEFNTVIFPNHYE